MVAYGLEIADVRVGKGPDVGTAAGVAAASVVGVSDIGRSSPQGVVSALFDPAMD